MSSRYTGEKASTLLATSILLIKSLEFARNVVLHGSIVIVGDSVTVGVAEGLALSVVEEVDEAETDVSLDALPWEKLVVLVAVADCDAEADEVPECENSCDALNVGDAVGVGLRVMEKNEVSEIVLSAEGETEVVTVSLTVSVMLLDGVVVRDKDDDCDVEQDLDIDWDWVRSGVVLRVCVGLRVWPLPLREGSVLLPLMDVDRDRATDRELERDDEALLDLLIVDVVVSEGVAVRLSDCVADGVSRNVRDLLGVGGGVTVADDVALWLRDCDLVTVNVAVVELVVLLLRERDVECVDDCTGLDDRDTVCLLREAECDKEAALLKERDGVAFVPLAVNDDVTLCDTVADVRLSVADVVSEKLFDSVCDAVSEAESEDDIFDSESSCVVVGVGGFVIKWVFDTETVIVFVVIVTVSDSEMVTALFVPIGDADFDRDVVWVGELVLLMETETLMDAVMEAVASRDSVEDAEALWTSTEGDSVTEGLRKVFVGRCDSDNMAVFDTDHDLDILSPEGDAVVLCSTESERCWVLDGVGGSDKVIERVVVDVNDSVADRVNGSDRALWDTDAVREIDDVVDPAEDWLLEMVDDAVTGGGVELVTLVVISVLFVFPVAEFEWSHDVDGVTVWPVILRVGWPDCDFVCDFCELEAVPERVAETVVVFGSVDDLEEVCTEQLVVGDNFLVMVPFPAAAAPQHVKTNTTNISSQTRNVVECMWACVSGYTLLLLLFLGYTRFNNAAVSNSA
jgi:hypothetical protein